MTCLWRYALAALALGALVSCARSSTLPPEPIDCASPADCPAGWSCEAGLCVSLDAGALDAGPGTDAGPAVDRNTPGFCASDDDCGSGERCAGTLCVGSACTDDEGCPGPMICGPQGCTWPDGCTSDAECPDRLGCVAGRCIRAPRCGEHLGFEGYACSGITGDSCIDGQCTRGCTEPGFCDYMCNMGTGLCAGGRFQCEGDADCPGGWRCRTGYCFTPVACSAPGAQAECRPGWTCGAGAICVRTPSCTDDGDCTRGVNDTCIAGECQVDSCASNSDCWHGWPCVDGACEPALFCGHDDDCPTGLRCDAYVCTSAG